MNLISQPGTCRFVKPASATGKGDRSGQLGIGAAGQLGSWGVTRATTAAECN